MDLPLDPTTTDAPPQELVRGLDSRTARRRVLQSADIDIDTDARGFAGVLDELSRIELRRAASQLRFAGARTVYYYRIDGLHRVSPDGATGRAGDANSVGVYGPEVRTVVSDHGRIFVVCAVPETGTQTQLAISDDARPTTVAVFEPGTQILAVRAPDGDTADATVRAVSDYFELDGRTSVSFLDGGFRGRFEDACVEGYSTLRLRNTDHRDDTGAIEVRSERSDDRADVRGDAIVRDLLRRRDAELDAATGLVSVPTDVRADEHDGPLRPSVTIGFPEGRVTFEQFVPESVLLAVNDAVRQAL